VSGVSAPRVPEPRWLHEPHTGAAAIVGGNSAAPYGDHPRLRSVELAARGLDRLMQPDISIPQELRLPNPHSSSGQLAWPPPQPSFAIQLLHAMYPGNHAYAELARSDEAAGS
jgi:hypothetical protein